MELNWCRCEERSDEAISPHVFGFPARFARTYELVRDSRLLRCPAVAGRLAATPGCITTRGHLAATRPVIPSPHVRPLPDRVLVLWVSEIPVGERRLGGFPTRLWQPLAASLLMQAIALRMTEWTGRSISDGAPRRDRVPFGHNPATAGGGDRGRKPTAAPPPLFETEGCVIAVWDCFAYFSFETTTTSHVWSA